jgi:hypothetical protein
VAAIPFAAILALAQAAAEPIAVSPADFRLKPQAAETRIAPERCPEGRGGEIVVCGHRGEGQRLRPLVPPPGVREKQPLGLDFGGVRVEPHVSEVGMPNGRVSKRITIDFKIPF